MNKYRALFVEESREHLEGLSRLLVELETTGDPASVVDEIFRHVHSVKGMAASMGYDPITTLAHRVEDVVGARRHRGSAFAPVVIDCLLRAGDALKAQVDAIEAGDTLEEQYELVRELGVLAEADPGEGAGGDELTMGIRVAISPASASPTVRAFLVHRRLAEIGDVLSCNPSLEELKAGEMPRDDVLFVVRTASKPDTISRTIRSIADVDGVTFEEASNPRTVRTVEAKPVEAPEAQKSSATVRVRTDILDTLIDTVGELFIARETLETHLKGPVHPEARAALDLIAGRIRELHDQVMTVRMMPMGTLMDRFPRLVRDLARSLDKDVELEIEGVEIELDRAILDHLDAPLIHTLRNAVDHAIESPKERRALGKPEKGRVTVTATRDRDSVLVMIEDDGRGLDPDALRQAAIEVGLVTREQAEQMSAHDAFFLICTPGFSTKGEVSDISGRGVGMDVVLQKVEELGGSLDITSETGKGTRFTFRLPLTLAIIPVLLVEAQRRIFAVPAAKVVAVREAGDDVMEQSAGASTFIPFAHALVKISPLSELLDLGGRRTGEQLVMIEDGRDLHALAVERILGYHEVVVKPLGSPLDRLDLFAGATVLGDGRPILILDLPKALRPRQAA